MVNGVIWGSQELAHPSQIYMLPFFSESALPGILPWVHEAIMQMFETCCTAAASQSPYASLFFKKWHSNGHHISPPPP